MGQISYIMKELGKLVSKNINLEGIYIHNGANFSYKCKNHADTSEGSSGGIMPCPYFAVRFWLSSLLTDQGHEEEWASSKAQHRMMPTGKWATNQDTDRLPREEEELLLFAVFKTLLTNTEDGKGTGEPTLDRSTEEETWISSEAHTALK